MGLILNLPFDFYLFEAPAVATDAQQEDRILELMVHVPLETERLRDVFGLEGNSLMMIVVAV